MNELELKMKELYEWLQGERYGYFSDNKGWINYGDINDEFEYNETEQQWELSRNHMIEKTINKMKELELIKEDK